jgi:hypothetical protein
LELDAPVIAGRDPGNDPVAAVKQHIAKSTRTQPTDASADPDPDAYIPGWYRAYFGTYTVNVKERFWVTHVVGSNMPTMIGTQQKRVFTRGVNA